MRPHSALLERLDPQQLRGLGLQIEASLLSESFAEFAKAAWTVLEPTAELKWGWALDAICEHLQAVTDGHIKRLLMNVPPGCMKSLLTGAMFPAWEWTRPELRSYRYLGTSHRQELAVRDNLKCRRLIQSRWYQDRWPLQLMGDQNAKTKFENVNTGFREAMAFQSMTGSRGDRVFLDDPLSVDQANSEADLRAAETTFREALPTRVNNDNSAIIVIMQRLADRDTSGIILEDKLPYVHLMLPMEFETKRRCTTMLGFKDPRKQENELLFPERFGAPQVAELKTTLGEYATAGQLQQNPVPRGGGLFKEAHVNLWRSAVPMPDMEFLLQSYDTAFTDKTANDPTACTVWAAFKRRRKDGTAQQCVLLMDAWDEHMTYTPLRKRVVRDWKERYGAIEGDLRQPGKRVDALLVEQKGSGISLLQDLRRANIPAIEYNPGKADKVARAQAVLPLWDADCVYVLESKAEPGKPVTWARPFVKQVTSFSTASTGHDDYVDTMTQALRFLRDNDLLALPVAEAEPETEQDYGPARRNAYD